MILHVINYSSKLSKVTGLFFECCNSLICTACSGTMLFLGDDFLGTTVNGIENEYHVIGSAAYIPMVGNDGNLVPFIRRASFEGYHWNRILGTKSLVLGGKKFEVPRISISYNLFVG